MRPVSWTERALRRLIPPVLGAAGLAVSYSHVRAVAHSHGADWWAAHSMAVSVELMAVGAALEIRARRRAGQSTFWAWVVLVVGIVATVAANLETAAARGWGTAVAVWPAVAYLLAASLEATRPDRAAVDLEATRAAALPAPAHPAGHPAHALPTPPGSHLPTPGQDDQPGPWDNLPIDLEGVADDGPDREDLPEPDPLLDGVRQRTAHLPTPPGRTLVQRAAAELGEPIGWRRADRIVAILAAERETPGHVPGHRAPAGQSA